MFIYASYLWLECQRHTGKANINMQVPWVMPGIEDMPENMTNEWMN